MDRLKLDLRTMDVGAWADSPEAFADRIRADTLESWDQGADLVLFPEFTWMVLERFVDPRGGLDAVAGMFWGSLWPGLQRDLSRAGKAVVLGSSPHRDERGALSNRVPILRGGVPLFQDKIHLTPWERELRGGGPVRLWEFAGWRIAVVVCLDIEIPEIAVALRTSGVDLILVPSATDNLLGVERINRCASARAVELGCYVGVCPLLGRMDSEWVDVNVGSLALYSPSQSPCVDLPREDRGEVLQTGFHRRSFELSRAHLAKMDGETHPAALRPGDIAVSGP